MFEVGTAKNGKYAAIEIRASQYVQHELYFITTFWAFVANFSGLALGIHAGLNFIMSSLNTFENERAMISELYKY